MYLYFLIINKYCMMKKTTLIILSEKCELYTYIHVYSNYIYMFNKTLLLLLRLVMCDSQSVIFALMSLSVVILIPLSLSLATTDYCRISGNYCPHR